ncbi:MAG TPA: hypothetical protein VHY59_05715, partial [Chthoniobacterales bacterium]|nr:hypothetical protein [Chthoniobacterales bacterium]
MLSGSSRFYSLCSFGRVSQNAKAAPLQALGSFNVPGRAAILLGTRPAFFHLANFTLQSRWTGRTPAARLLFFRDAPVSGVNFSLLQ